MPYYIFIKTVRYEFIILFVLFLVQGENIFKASVYHEVMPWKFDSYYCYYGSDKDVVMTAVFVILIIIACTYAMFK